MKYLFVFILCYSVCLNGLTQSAGISNSGKYIYFIESSVNSKSSSLILQSTNSSFKREFNNANSPQFVSEDDLFFFKRADSVFVYSITNDNIRAYENVLSYQLISKQSSSWIVYLNSKSSGKLSIENLKTKQLFVYENVIDFQCGKDILIKTKDERTTALGLIDLANGSYKPIWKGNDVVIGNYIIGTLKSNVAFIVNVDKKAELWMYTDGDQVATLLLDRKRLENSLIDTTIYLANRPIRFVDDCKKILFCLREDRREPILGIQKIEVWSSYDNKLFSLQKKDKDIDRNFLAVFNTDNKKVVRLERENERVLGFDNLNISDSRIQIVNEHALVIKFRTDIFAYDQTGKIDESYSMSEWTWNSSRRSTVCLKSLRDGTEQIIQKDIFPRSSNFPYFKYSPKGRYVVFFDHKKLSYFSFDVRSGSLKELTKNIPTPWVKENIPGNPNSLNGVCGWLAEDSAVLLSDSFTDIWMIDLLGLNSPVNITNKYAKKNSLNFICKANSSVVNRQEGLLIEARSIHSFVSSRSYFKANFQNEANPRALIPTDSNFDYQFIAKAADSRIYLFIKTGRFQPDVAVYLSDFKNTKEVPSNFKKSGTPLTKELIKWKTYDGKIGEGILLKPKNFNPSKRYPVIIEYYEAPRINYYTYTRAFPKPINDSDYIMFFPGIKYTVGKTGQSAYNYVVSGAEHISHLPYVDAKKMGIYGGSFGGYETNYLVTHSNMFAAAWTSCGVSNMVSLFGTEDKDEQGKSNSDETGQHRMGTNLWERPNIIIENSPIFSAHRVSTPLLITHYRDDYRVPFSQSVELFKALRRLGKRVWLLTSDNGGHGGPAGPDGIYVKQFFDHYLRDQPAAKWMIEGMTASTIGIDYGFELVKEKDKNGKWLTPKEGGLLTDEEKKKVEALKRRKPITIKLD